MIQTNASKIYNLVGAEAVLTEAADLRKYITGLSTSFGYVISDENGSTFYTDTRYLEAAVNALQGTEIAVKKYEGLENILKSYKQVAIPVGRTLYNDYQNLKSSGLEIVDSMPAFVSAMSVKEDYELALIERACSIADKALISLLGSIKEGMTENEVAAQLEFLMRKFGASGTSFESIVAFGENSSVPHHETGARKLKYGDVILIDYGCKYGGYCSDCTRTYLFGDDKKHEDFKKAYTHVLLAHNLVKEQVTCGITGREADAVARDYLKTQGLDKFFTHTLGHGIGINVHESPSLSPKSSDVLLNGMVFSDEPGVYLKGEYGIRIEDSITLDEGKVVSLTDTDRKLTVL